MQFTEGARQAKGLTVVIDVFRAFSLACYLFDKGAAGVIPVGELDEARKWKEDHPDYILIGERKGVIQPGFDYGNSPAQILDVDLEGKTIVHTTSAGTQGIVNAIHADEIITGSFVNADAIVRYIQKQRPAVVSIVAMGWRGQESAAEDDACSQYIKHALLGKSNDFASIKHELKHNRKTASFLDVKDDDSAPKQDFEYCMDLNRFSFVLKAEKQNEDGSFRFVRIDV